MVYFLLQAVVSIYLETLKVNFSGFTFSKEFVQEYNPSVDWFGSRTGLIFYQA